MPAKPRVPVRPKDAVPRLLFLFPRSRVTARHRVENRQPSRYSLTEVIRLRTSDTKPSSVKSVRLISTFANAPSTAAPASAIPTARADAILGFVVVFKLLRILP